MGSYQWALEHKCSDEEVFEILEGHGFEKSKDEDEENLFVISINAWKPLKAELKSSSDIVFTFHWMGGSTTEIFFDYLIGCGVLIGRLMVALDNAYKEKA